MKMKSEACQVKESKTFASLLKWTEERNGEGRGRETCFTSPSQQMLLTVKRIKTPFIRILQAEPFKVVRSLYLEHRQLSAERKRFYWNCVKSKTCLNLVYLNMSHWYYYFILLNVKKYILFWHSWYCLFPCQGGKTSTTWRAKYSVGMCNHIPHLHLVSKDSFTFFEVCFKTILTCCKYNVVSIYVMVNKTHSSLSVQKKTSRSLTH